jgi:uncharacterized protein YukE
MADTYNEVEQGMSAAWGPPVGQADYDQVTIAAVPEGMFTKAQDLSNLAGRVADSLSRIQTTLESLVLDSWKGESQQEATDLANRWNDVMTDLFGTEDKPDDGVLNALADGVSSASGNFTKAEDGVIGIFNEFFSNLQGPPPSPDKPPPPEDDLDANNTAITVDYPGN